MFGVVENRDLGCPKEQGLATQLPCLGLEGGTLSGSGSAGMTLLSHGLYFAYLCVFRRSSSDTWYPLWIPERAGSMDWGRTRAQSSLMGTSSSLSQGCLVHWLAKITAPARFSQQQAALGKFTWECEFGFAYVSNGQNWDQWMKATGGKAHFHPESFKMDQTTGS